MQSQLGLVVCLWHMHLGSRFGGKQSHPCSLCDCAAWILRHMVENHFVARVDTMQVARQSRLHEAWLGLPATCP